MRKYRDQLSIDRFNVQEDTFWKDHYVYMGLPLVETALDYEETKWNNVKHWISHS